MRILITGISRGIGLALTHHALRLRHTVVGVLRSLDASPAAKALAAEYPQKLQIVELDLAVDGAIDRLHAALASDGAIDLLINNAGALPDGNTTQEFLDTYHINSVVPFQVTQSCLPLLKLSSSPRVVQITSEMGSIAENASGGYPAYRASKAALNILNKNLAVENDWLSTVVVHPGWVRTEMGGPSAPVDPRDSAAGIFRIAETFQPKDTGKFFNYEGEDLPW